MVSTWLLYFVLQGQNNYHFGHCVQHLFSLFFLIVWFLSFCSCTGSSKTVHKQFANETQRKYASKSFTPRGMILKEICLLQVESFYWKKDTCNCKYLKQLNSHSIIVYITNRFMRNYSNREVFSEVQQCCAPPLIHQYATIIQ